MHEKKEKKIKKNKTRERVQIHIFSLHNNITHFTMAHSVHTRGKKYMLLFIVSSLCNEIAQNIIQRKHKHLYDCTA